MVSNNLSFPGLAPVAPNGIPAPHAAIVFAGYYQFAADETVFQPRVQSRMLVWCKAGTGALRINGQFVPMEPGDFCFMPWNRELLYIADSSYPFMTAGIHLIPRLDPTGPIECTVPHDRQEPLYDCGSRGDVSLGVLDGIKRGSFAEAASLRHLAEYVVQSFREKIDWEWQSRILAHTLLLELYGYFDRKHQISPDLPAALRQMMEYVLSHPEEKMGLKNLSEVSKLSASAVGRMFQKHLGMGPINYITNQKIGMARQLLASTRLHVSDVGRRVGVEDPFYFSKLFRKSTGMTPLEYRKRSAYL